MKLFWIIWIAAVLAALGVVGWETRRWWKRRHRFPKGKTLAIYGGQPWSPYFVFIKGTDMTDRDVLEALGLADYVRIDSIESSPDYISIGRDSGWTHIADNFGYTHWHCRNFRTALSELCARHDVFTFSVGEADMSFDLELHRGGRLVRRFVWEDKDFSGGRLQEQLGTPLEGENTIPCGKDPLDGLWRVASALGIQTSYTKLDLALYAPTPEVQKRMNRGIS